MKKNVTAVVAATFLTLAAIPLYSAADTHESHHAGAEAQKSYAAKGEVISIDQDTGKTKIRHEAIPELGWSGMTMAFPVIDKDLVKNIKPGDKVDFVIAKSASSGQYTIQKLQLTQ